LLIIVITKAPGIAPMTLAVSSGAIALKLPWFLVARNKKTQIISAVSMTSMTVSLALNTRASSGAVMIA
jgi:hypothetical protein